MSLPIFTIDAFTSEQFRGNPAAVCPLEKDIPDEMKQKIAGEMNISETAFITKKSSRDSFLKDTTFGLRWFTPKTEVPLCGHATLAAAATLFYCYGNSEKELHFETLSGVLKARKDGCLVVLDLPQNPPEDLDQPQKLGPVIRAIIGDLPVQHVCFSARARKLLIRLQDSCSQEDMDKIKPNFSNLMEMGKCGLDGMMGVIVTLKDGDKHDFVSRYFAPWVGINEDPVTGSAHTVLGPYWAKVLGKNEMLALQCSPRGGELNLKLQDNGRIDVAGEAVVVLQGHLHITT